MKHIRKTSSGQDVERNSSDIQIGRGGGEGGGGTTDDEVEGDELEDIGEEDHDCNGQKEKNNNNKERERKI